MSDGAHSEPQGSQPSPHPQESKARVDENYTNGLSNLRMFNEVTDDTKSGT